MESRFAMQTRNLMELSAVWPLSHADLMDWFNGPAMTLSDAEYGLVIQKLKHGGLKQTEVRELVDIPFLVEAAT